MINKTNISDGIIMVNMDFRHYGKFPDGAFVVSDPPYNQGYHYKQYKDNIQEQEYFDLLSSAFGGNKSVIIHYPEPTINILSKIGKCEESVAWVYNSNTGKQSRLITWWGCRPDFRKVGQPYKNPTDKRIAKRIADGKQGRLYDWWNINQIKNVSKKDNPHPCPMPIEIMRRIILTTTNPGDMIIDPFAGSGTTGIACAITGRKFMGFEIDKVYYSVACERIKKALDNP